MAEDLLTQRTLQKVIGQSRLRRLCASGWLLPVKRSPGKVLSLTRVTYMRP